MLDHTGQSMAVSRCLVLRLAGDHTKQWSVPISVSFRKICKGRQKWDNVIRGGGGGGQRLVTNRGITAFKGGQADIFQGGRKRNPACKLTQQHTFRHLP